MFKQSYEKVLFERLAMTGMLCIEKLMHTSIYIETARVPL